MVPLFFLAVLVLGLLVFRDYGLSIDENQQRDTGMISLKHVALKVAPAWVKADHDFDKYNTPLAEYYDRDYGTAFETPVCLAERLLGLSDGGDKFLFRHLCTFLVCFGGLIAVYQLAARRFRNWRLGLLAALWLLLSPRLFAEFFYNDKDAVFMALFAIATNTGVRLLLRPTARRAAWHALVCAITIDVRIMGVLLPLLTVALLGWRALRGEVRWPRAVGTSALYLVVLAGAVVALWPYLWPAPLDNFVAAFEKMSAFRWGGMVLYRGDFIIATDLPWHYALVWMAITTPVLYVGAGLLGLGLVVRQVVRQRWRLWQDEAGLQDVVFLGLFAGPLLAVIALHSVLYDGWRQVYFVYPAFLLLALRGWVAAAAWRPRWAWWPKALYGATALSALVIAAQMVRDHPLQNVYFNVLAGRHVAERFEMDYWGLGYRQDLEYIIEHETRPVVTVFAPGPSPAEFNRLMLPAFQRERLQFVDKPENADYFITNYRWHPEPYPYDFEVHQVRADGRRVHSVFRLR
ncbi:hypothetical protein [Hymenobacter ruricola]|uniref:Glycosyltransferase RgtA/B/C/D-like domain-containing protein n=1 Tax=Hymenobacter ruricola TaxID=2791023 RepID=A0ABS0I9U1_9BACT|nr:hypothetical protein [Hymenobacter ruricola]MBF9223734.1 hypothetical protein [Hymenobacter ruricola]